MRSSPKNYVRWRTAHSAWCPTTLVFLLLIKRNWLSLTQSIPYQKIHKTELRPQSPFRPIKIKALPRPRFHWTIAIVKATIITNLNLAPQIKNLRSTLIDSLLSNWKDWKTNCNCQRGTASVILTLFSSAKELSAQAVQNVTNTMATLTWALPWQPQGFSIKRSSTFAVSLVDVPWTHIKQHTQKTSSHNKFSTIFPRQSFNHNNFTKHFTPFALPNQIKTLHKHF